MKRFSEILQTADWKSEKHVPVIECPDSVTGGQKFQLSVTIGKEIPHPNTTEHHIEWVHVYFQPEGEKFPYQLASFEFQAHGATTQGPNTGPAYSDPQASGTFVLKKSGTLLAMASCNIHGLWEASRDIKVV